jgi:hypothetical protein
MIWLTFKPLAWILLLFSAILLLLAAFVTQGWTQFIVPPPENTAAQLVSALGAHRYEGAMNQLSEDLQQQVKHQDLQNLVKAIEESPAGGIQYAHEQNSEQQDDQATAEVQVTLKNNRQVNIQLPLKQENGVWRITSLDPIRELASP